MISKSLRRLMDAKGLTVEQLVARIQTGGGDTSYPTICGYLAGRRSPTLNSARALADALGCTTDDLCDDDAA